VISDLVIPGGLCRLRTIKKADSGSCPPFRGPALRRGLRLCIYFPELEADAGCEFAFGMLTYPLTVSLPTLLTTNSSGILVPLR